MQQIFYELASDEQLVFFADAIFRRPDGRIGPSPVRRVRDRPPRLGCVDPTKMMRRQGAMMPVAKMQLEKEGRGELHLDDRSLRDRGDGRRGGACSIEEYWGEIIAACFLDDRGPGRPLARG